MLLYEIVDSFESQKLDYALVGGYALALHGLVRATMDVDFVLTLRQSDFELAEKALGNIGLKSRLPIRAEDIIKMRKEYIEQRNLIAWSFVDYSNPSRQVDILITKDLKKMKTQKISVAGRKITVATLQEILKMKEEAGRPQDLIDITNIKEKLSGKK
ncbi:nucleotidyl transferase AbiEii/AbiGii toxin family protein [Bdellovibrio bacteriovorus]|nr:nucleotidyl transferase AbiEii/AbiGii toxin family protein [Bdellovibrio bacteriovorus]